MKFDLLGFAEHLAKLPGAMELEQHHDLKAVEAVPAVAHDLASLGHVAELLGKLEQAGFGSNDLLVLGHGGVLRCGQQTPSVRLSPDFFIRSSRRSRSA